MPVWHMRLHDASRIHLADAAHERLPHGMSAPVNFVRWRAGVWTFRRRKVEVSYLTCRFRTITRRTVCAPVFDNLLLTATALLECASETENRLWLSYGDASPGRVSC